jgi:hypothetical protein
VSDNPMFLYAGEYENVDDAKADLETLKEVGEMLEGSEAALIVVGEPTIERAVDDATRRAKKELKKEVRADAKEMEWAIDRA